MFDPVHKSFHLFYQYQTPRMWGHAVSKDLVHWKQLPMALKRKKTYDKGGDYSGSATILDDAAQTPLLTVSSSTNDVIWLAVPQDRSDPWLTEWKYVDTNPVIRTNARDPTELMKTSNGKYRMAVGERAGTALWEATDISHIWETDWRKIGYLAENNGSIPYYECPDVFPLSALTLNGDGSVSSQDGQTSSPLWVHKVSLMRKGDWWEVGNYDEDKGSFSPLGPLTRVDHNPRYYAAKTFLAPPAAGTMSTPTTMSTTMSATTISTTTRTVPTAVPGLMRGTRRILWAWLVGVDGSKLPWTGILGVPREVSLVVVDHTGHDAKNRRYILRSYPIEELTKLRGPQTDFGGLVLSGSSPSSHHALDSHPGDMFDLEAAIVIAAPEQTPTDGTFSQQLTSSSSCGVRILQRETSFVAISIEVMFHADGTHKKNVLVQNVGGMSRNQGDDSPIQSSHHSEDFRFEVPTLTEESPSDPGNVSVSTHLRVLVDKGVVEIFVDRGAATYWLYHLPTEHTYPVDVTRGVTAVGGEMRCGFSQLLFWQMRQFKYDVSLCENTQCL
jgi:sucrose-6-phosphate hydrolase SacC (GH32 family)